MEQATRARFEVQNPRKIVVEADFEARFRSTNPEGVSSCFFRFEPHGTCQKALSLRSGHLSVTMTNSVGSWQCHWHVCRLMSGTRYTSSVELHLPTRECNNPKCSVLVVGPQSSDLVVVAPPTFGICPMDLAPMSSLEGSDASGRGCDDEELDFSFCDSKQTRRSTWSPEVCYA